MKKYDQKQIKLVEFSEKVYHEGLRHRGVNGSLYEDALIHYLRMDIPELTFFKGQIKDGALPSSQFDVIICKKHTKQPDFIEKINPYINLIDRKECLAVIELKKWGFPEMLSKEGSIQKAHDKFKKRFPNLNYYFLCLRYKERKDGHLNNWNNLKEKLSTDGNFCFFGNSNDKDNEWRYNWIKNTALIEKNTKFLGEYKRLIDIIRAL